MLRGFSGGKQGIKSVNTRIQSSLFNYLHNRKLRSFDLKKNENRKIWVEVILNAVGDSRNLHSKELWLKTCRSLHLHFAWLKSSPYFEGINKPDRDNSTTRIGNFITCVPFNCSYPINLKVPAKIECNMNKVYPCLYSSVSLINIIKCIPTYKNF